MSKNHEMGLEAELNTYLVEKECGHFAVSLEIEMCTSRDGAARVADALAQLVAANAPALFGGEGRLVVETTAVDGQTVN